MKISFGRVMTNPKFAWIKELLKKRGLPDLATLDANNTKLKDILSLSKHRGGKSILETANIQDFERTNEKECVSAKIFLKEV